MHYFLKKKWSDGNCACEIFTIVPMIDSDDIVFVPIGLADKFNSAGAIVSFQQHEADRFTIQLRSPGRFVAWCKHPPAKVSEAEFSWNNERLDVHSKSFLITVQCTKEKA